MIEKNQPNYKKIYMDILHKKYPEKAESCELILAKKVLTGADIIELNERIFGKGSSGIRENQKHKSYSEKDILHILKYQKEYKMNNSEISSHFKMSRNTITKWRKIYCHKI